MPLIGMTSDLAGKYSGQEHETKGQKPNGGFRILSHAFSQIEDVPQRNRKVQGSPFLERIPCASHSGSSILLQEGDSFQRWAPV